MRVGSNLSGIDMRAQNGLMKAFSMMSQSSTRLSTSKRINSGSDDPAGLIALENMQAELTALKQASYNASRASGTIQVADSGLAEVSSLLNTIRGNVVAAAGGGLSDAEVAAKQIEVDAALEAINRIGNTTSFSGKKVLQGGSMTLALSPDLSQTSTLDLPTVNTAALGGATGMLHSLGSGGDLNLSSGNMADAMDVLDEARAQVAGARGSLGAFEKYTIESTQNVLADMEVNISAAVSSIGDADMAEESSQLLRAQILVDTGISSLMIAGQSRGMISQLFSEM